MNSRLPYKLWFYLGMCSRIRKSRWWKLERQVCETRSRAIPMPIRLLWRSTKRNTVPALSMPFNNSIKSVTNLLQDFIYYTEKFSRFGRECFLDFDDQVTCTCPLGYSGRRCEQCSAGYDGNPLIPGQRCSPGTFFVLSFFNVSISNVNIFSGFLLFFFIFKIGGKSAARLTLCASKRCCLNTKKYLTFSTVFQNHPKCLTFQVENLKLAVKQCH